MQGVNQIKNLDFFLKKSHNSKPLDPDGTKEPLRLSGENSDFSDTDDGQTQTGTINNDRSLFIDGFEGNGAPAYPSLKNKFL